MLITGVGEAKLREFGGRFLDVLTRYCREKGLEVDVLRARTATMPVAAPHLTGNSELYFNLFRQAVSRSRT